MAEEEAHLFVLIHGLWGSPSHMLTVERAVKNSLIGVSKERVVTIKPSSFRFWKTYDGIQHCAEKVITDLLYEIETLKLKNKCKVVKISIVGYSLGGLIARYVVGLLEEMGFFEEVKPVFFCTFATPHVGVHFFRTNFFDRTANFLGKYLFGRTGLQLFVMDSPRLLVEMADPGSRYYQGLLRFEKLLLLANIRNDRSVAFYTSYVTEYSPFERWDTVNIKYLKGLPASTVGKSAVRPKFVDLRRSHKVSKPEERTGNKQEATSVIRSNKILRWSVIVLAAAILIPFYVPLILCISFYVSAYSVVKLRFVKKFNLLKHWDDVKLAVYRGGVIDAKHTEQGETRRKQRRRLARHESFKGDTSQFTENAMENMLLAEERFANPGNFTGEDEDSGEADIPHNDESESESDDTTALTATILKRSILDIKTDENDVIAEKYLTALENADQSEFPLFAEGSQLAFSDDQKTIVENLNKLDWIKIPVYHDLFNAHDGIVARRGEKTNPKGTCTIYLWGSILRNHIKNTYESS